MESEKAKKQHGKSQVYLKEFQFRDKDNKRILSVWEKGKNSTQYAYVKGFSNISDQFDIFNVEGVDQRVFDQINDTLENLYPRIIRELAEKGTLSTENRALVREIAANFLCRTPRLRDLVWDLFNNPKGKDGLLSDIASSGSPDTVTAIKYVDNVPVDGQLNFLMLFAMRHIHSELVNFHCVILEDYDGRGWATSDNPVILDNNGKYYSLIPFEAELYFPFSKKYCIYLHSSRSENKKGWLKSLPNGTVVKATKDLHQKIMLEIAANATKYVVFPWDMKKTDLEKLAGKSFIFKKLWYKFTSWIRRQFVVKV